MKSERAKTIIQKKKILDRLLKLWVSNSELRLGQLIGNAFSVDYEMFHIEDFDFIKIIEEEYILSDEESVRITQARKDIEDGNFVSITPKELLDPKKEFSELLLDKFDELSKKK